ncbi:MAG: carboxypeptidase regulatory-like domain-containing protein, partial [Candidatus Marinimicrobia bacterium]|nr:carboxypeptidase regulatory-like domain-containing protein [Candidatus Neomarinimicrobiota bacterium]
MRNLTVYLLTVIITVCFVYPELAYGQGLTTSRLSGKVTDDDGNPLAGTNVVATHEPTGIQYGAAVRNSGHYDILNMKVGGPYTVSVTYIGYQEQSEENVYLSLGQSIKIDFQMTEQAIEVAGVVVTAEVDEVMNSGRTGAATYVSVEQVQQMPSIKRSVRDLTRLDPRSDGNMSFGGRNWL